MERNRTIALCCVSIATTFFILIASLVADPVPLEADPADIERLEVGTLVAVEGRIDEDGIKDLGGAAVFRLLGEGGDAVQVFLGSPPGDLRPGDGVRLVGTVSLYKGLPEIVVRSTADIVVVSRDPRPRVPLEHVLADPWAYSDVEPIVEVVVETPPVSRADGNGSWCVVSGSPVGPFVAMLVPPGSEPGTWAVGTRLDVACLIRYDTARGVVYLEPTEWWAV
jgi:hypothetical protein